MQIISTTADPAAFAQDDEQILVTQDGSVVSSTDAVDSFYDGNDLFNRGTLIAEDDGVYAFNPDFLLQNTAGGYIFGNRGVHIKGAGAHIDNMGVMSGDAFGINIFASKFLLENSGSVTANNTEAVHIEGADARIINTGAITGPVGLYLNVERKTGSVINSGSITGEAFAFYKEGGGTLSFRNTGTIDGNVTFVDGTNRFDGRKGEVAGTVAGGSGADTILAGDDGETFGGGKGHDRLVAGAGADTIVFSSYAAGDSDVVKGFDPGHDRIQLDHTVFSHLAVDAAPAFTIGSKASSAMDFLFYNASNGVLSYDRDGSGTQVPAYAIADFGKGLHLSAANFDVV